MTVDQSPQTTFGLSTIRPEPDAERDQIITNLVALMDLLNDRSGNLEPLERNTLKRIARRLCGSLGLPVYPFQIDDESM